MNRRAFYEYTVAGTIYLAVALALFLPIIRNPYSTVVGSTYDVYQNMWDYWWIKYAIANHLNIYYTMLLGWPYGINLAYMTLQPLTGLVSIPFQLVSLPFAYNAMFFLGFLITGIGAYALAKQATGNKYAAFIAGFVFAFSAFHIAQSYGHAQWFFLGWIPLFIYFFIKMLESNGTEKYKMASAAGVMFVLVVFMGDIEPGLIAAFAALAIMLAYALFRETRKKLLDIRVLYALVIMSTTALILGSFGFYHLFNALMMKGSTATINEMNSIQNNMQWSDNLLSFFLPSYYNSIFNSYAVHDYYYIYGIGGPQDRVSYIGYIAIALALYGIYKSFASTKILIVIAIIFALLALGPFVQIGPINTHIPTLYLAYHKLPFVNFVREPGRFDAIVELAVAVTAAIGFDALQKKTKITSGKKLYLMIAIICALYLIESAGAPISSTFTPHVPAFIKTESTYKGNFSTLILPALPQPNNDSPAEFTAQSDYYTTVLHKPIIGGYITRENSTLMASTSDIPIVIYATSLQYGIPYSTPLKANATLMAVQTMVPLRIYNTDFVIIENKAFSNNEFASLYNLSRFMFSEPVYQSPNITVFFAPNMLRNPVIANFTGFIPMALMNTWGNAKTPYGIGWFPGSGGIGVITAAFDGPQKKSYNMHLGFDTLAQQNSKIDITVTLGSNTTYRTILANVPTGISKYSANLTLPYSPYGYDINFYEPSAIYTNGEVANITFISNITVT
ncbi:MAG: hypothetical protein ACP5RM_02955 [Candidatus Micrarchaeia archaeon]